jgi:glycosyltransferase involved in cell wall biosynthesis
MRIAHYAPRIWAPGGISTYIQRLGAAQSSQGHDVIYLGREETSHSTPSLPYQPVSDDQDLFRSAHALDVDILHLHKSVHVLPSDRVPTIRTMHGHQGGCPSGTRYLQRPGRACDRAYTIPGCLWGHFVDRCGSIRPHNLADNFARIRREIKLASTLRTLTVSDFLRKQMLRAGCAPDRLYTVPSPAPSTDRSFAPVSRDAPPRFLFLGRLVQKKGVFWLLRAFAEVNEPAILDVAGEGPERERAETLARELGIRDRVTFHGWVPSDDVPALMQDARAVIFPSVWHEPAGLVSLEAAAYGRSLIASRVGGIPEYAHEDHALLVTPHDTDDLARAITKLILDPDRADQLGKAGYRRARNQHAMSRFIERLHAHYRAVRSAAPSSA